MEKPEAIIIGGVTGTGLQRIAETLSSFSREGYRVVNAEKIVESEIGAAIVDVLDMMFRSPHVFKSLLSKAFETVVKEASEAEKSIIVMHLSYLRRKHIVPSPLLYRVLESLRVKALLVIVEDYYHGLQRIAERVVKESYYIEDTIDPLLYLQWRAYDFGIAVSLLYKGLRVLVFNAKHRVETYRRLSRHILDDEPARLVYFSHHIRLLRELATRENIPLRELPEVKEIEEFKQWLIDSCPGLILFEPTTIDELITSREGRLETRITLENRWPHDYETVHEYRYPVDLTEPLFTQIYDTDMVLKHDYLNTLAETITSQIVSRDLFYVNQSNIVLAYRPVMKGKSSRGMTIEFTTASAQGKPVYAYIEDDTEYATAREMFTEFMFRRVKDRDQLLYVLRCIG